MGRTKHPGMSKPGPKVVEVINTKPRAMQIHDAGVRLDAHPFAIQLEKTKEKVTGIYLNGLGLQGSSRQCKAGESGYSE